MLIGLVVVLVMQVFERFVLKLLNLRLYKVIQRLDIWIMSCIVLPLYTLGPPLKRFDL